jgi:hypothetical protein
MFGLTSKCRMISPILIVNLHGTLVTFLEVLFPEGCFKGRIGFLSAQ